MAAAAMFEIHVHAIKWTVNPPILMKIGAQTKKNMLSSKITKTEVFAKFQDGCHRHFGNSSACYKMGNYDPIFDENWYTD
jgi:hypothetical protein